ncbi:hypothetical protein Tco_1354189 [Tanacetum coccineum]
MSTFIKNQSSWKLSQLKKLSFEEMTTEFEKLMKSIESFMPMETEEKVKRHGLQLEQETSKKQKIDIEDDSITKEKVDVVKEEETEVPVKKTGKRRKQKARKGINIDKTAQDEFNKEREAYVKDKVKDTSSESKIGVDVFQLLQNLLLLVVQIGDKEVNTPEEMYDKVLSGDLKTMFDPPLSDDAIWSLPLQQRIINWSSASYIVSTGRRIIVVSTDLSNGINSSLQDEGLDYTVIDRIEINSDILVVYRATSKCDKELVGFTPRRRIGFRKELVQGATPICEGSCRLTSLERQEVWNDCRSCKVRVGLNGNLLWEASVLLGRKKGNEPILHCRRMQTISVVYYDARSKDLEAAGNREKVIASVFDFEAIVHMERKENVDVWLPGSKKEGVLMPRVVKSRDEIFSRWGYCDNRGLSRLDNQSIERDRLIGIGFVLYFVEFISFTFGDKEMILVIEALCVLDRMSTPTQCCDMGSDGYAYPVYDMFGIVDPNMQNEFEISSWRGARVDVRTYLLGGAIDSSEANGIIRDPKLELENSRFTFDLVPLSYESVDVANRISYGISTRSDADLRRLVSFDLFFRKARGVERLQELQGEGWFEWVHGDDVAKTVFRMRNGHVEVYGYAFWVNQCTSGFHGVNEPVAREDDRGVSEGREDVREVFQQHESEAKRKLSRCGRNQMGNEPILALPEGADDFVVYYDARSKDLEACLEKGEGDCLLTNRWLSMKKDISSCGSKYLAYLEVEVEYQGSSGLLQRKPGDTRVDIGK